MMQLQGLTVKLILAEHEIWGQCGFCYFKFLPDQQEMADTYGQRLYTPNMKTGVPCPTCGDTSEVSLFLSAQYRVR